MLDYNDLRLDRGLNECRWPTSMTHRPVCGEVSLDILIIEVCNIPGLRLIIAPWVQDGIHSIHVRVLTFMALLPLPPQAVDVGVMHPENGVGWSGEQIAHGPSHPVVHPVVDVLEAGGEVRVGGRLHHCVNA